MSLAEKFQITIPAKDEDGEEWASFKSARNVDCVPDPGMGTKFNRMPVSQIACKYDFVQGFGGNTDVTGDVEPSSLIKGYKRREMKGTDDQYSGEHVDLFYGEAVDEKGNVGFAERNNYLDRI